jgi:hypothetical protein
LNASADIVAVRKALTARLDTGEHEEGFRFNSRRLDLTHLAVVVFVQDDATHEIVAARYVPIDNLTGTALR